MPLQNRVSPFSVLVATPERGFWTGNRGVIHNAHQQIVKNHAVKYWITCVLRYKNYQRTVMSPNRWTELFFLDEATAFAAGHRPCGFCRHADFKRFKNLWLAANGAQHSLSPNPKMDTIDALIHADRLDEKGHQRTFKAELSTLPDGSFVAPKGDSKACLWYNGNLFEWSFSGYTKLGVFEKNQIVTVLTPQSFISVFRLGYVPEVHISAISI
jgi:hypothetical protein